MDASGSLALISEIISSKGFWSNEPSYDDLKIVHDFSLKADPVHLMAVRFMAAQKAKIFSGKSYSDLLNLKINTDALSLLDRQGYLVTKTKVDKKDLQKNFFESKGISSHSPSAGGDLIHFRGDLPRFAVGVNELITNQQLFNIFNSPSLLSIIGHYLGCPPTITELASVFTRRTNRLQHAQTLHRDINGFGWITVFLYCSDINQDNGPHVFLPTTHRIQDYDESDDLPSYTNAYGHDAAYLSHYKDVCEFTGPAGTLIIEDTIGLHAGKPLTSSGQGRLVAWCVYSITPSLYRFSLERSINYGEQRYQRKRWERIKANPSDLESWSWRLFLEE